ncbi:MAG TPA: hypothetical protein VNA14_09935 [Mycobacteriales bacterium]|nr:hypothetical protein [Mycobacteriales bacterium]
MHRRLDGVPGSPRVRWRRPFCLVAVRDVDRTLARPDVACRRADDPADADAVAVTVD